MEAEEIKWDIWRYSSPFVPGGHHMWYGPVDAKGTPLYRWKRNPLRILVSLREGREVGPMKPGCGEPLCINPAHAVPADRQVAWGKGLSVEEAEPLRERLERHLETRGDCRVWVGAKRKGRGQLWAGGDKKHIPQRVAFVLAYSTALPEGVRVRATCAEPMCCAKEHLRVERRALNGAEVIAVRESPLSNHDLARIYGVHVTTIRAVRRGVRHCVWGGNMNRQADRNPNCRLDWKKAAEIRRLRVEERLPLAVIAAAFGVHHSTVADVVYGRSWRVAA